MKSRGIVSFPAAQSNHGDRRLAEEISRLELVDRFERKSLTRHAIRGRFQMWLTTPPPAAVATWSETDRCSGSESISNDQERTVPDIVSASDN